MIRAALICAAVAGPAWAQEPSFDLSRTEGCLATTPAAERRACIGRSAQACIDGDQSGGTTVGMSFCLEREHTFWDARLNDAYGKLRAREKTRDAEIAQVGGSAPSLAEALRDMQRAWIPYRDATCDYERAQWGGGTGGGPATWACLMRLTGEQALALEEALREG